LVLNHPSGIGILAAPINPVSEQLHSAALTYIYQVLAEGFRRIVVDVPSNFSPMSVATLRQASHVVLIAGDDPAKLASAPGVLAKVQQLSLPGQMHVVINRTRPHGITNMDVMQALNQPVAADIPYEAQQVNAIMQGAPLLMSHPGSLFAKTILYLARTL
jgi:Flp pilus assembly CpaE family ATPase